MTPTHDHSLSLDQVDAVNWAAHRIVLYGHLVANILDDQWKEGALINEGLQELVTSMIDDADTIKTIMAASCPTAPQETAAPV